jgi:hypothetical protein
LKSKAVEEAIMVAIVKKTGRQFSQWLKALRERYQPPHKWYEYDHYAG